jgi:hypothetical protein
MTTERICTDYLLRLHRQAVKPIDADQPDGRQGRPSCQAPNQSQRASHCAQDEFSLRRIRCRRRSRSSHIHHCAVGKTQRREPGGLSQGYAGQNRRRSSHQQDRPTDAVADEPTSSSSSSTYVADSVAHLISRTRASSHIAAASRHTRQTMRLLKFRSSVSLCKWMTGARCNSNHSPRDRSASQNWRRLGLSKNSVADIVKRNRTEASSAGQPAPVNLATRTGANIGTSVTSPETPNHGHRKIEPIPSPTALAKR